MKKYALQMLMALLLPALAACSGSKVKEEAPIAADSLTADTCVTDTLESMIEEQPMPKAADELFDDFFFNFAGNRKLQIQRIAFPLTVKRDGEVEQRLEKQQWHVDHFFIPQEYYTLILDNRKQMNLVKDTAVSHVVVEKINLHTHHVKQYVFNRDNGLWMLKEICHLSIAHNHNASFLTFYEKFSTDSLFQIESMDESVVFSAPDPDDDFNTLTGTIEPEQWPMFKPSFIPTGVIYNIIYGKQPKESKKKIFMVRGIANGLEMEMVFEQKEGHWKLVKFDS